MWKHYLTTALRHFIKHKVTTGINVICLAAGLTCFVVAWGTTTYFSKLMDSHHANAEKIYALTTDSITEQGSVTLPINPWLLAEHLRADFRQLQAVARATSAKETAIVIDGTGRFADVVYADPELLKVFDFPLIEGDGKSALDAPHSAIVTEDLAKRIFGTTDVVGRTFRLGTGKDTVAITGVLGSMPQPTHLTNGASPLSLKFEALLSMDNRAREAHPTWRKSEYYTYALAPADGSLTLEDFNKQLEGFTNRNVPAEDAGSVRFGARPIVQITGVTYDLFVGTASTGVSSMTALLVLGGLVLLVACLNYANLATAQAAVRAREIALRMAIGASRSRIATQYLMEGLLLTASALAVALLCIVLVAATAGTQKLGVLVSLFAGLPQFWIFLVTSIVLVALVASAYPAFVLSRVTPASALRGKRANFGSRLITTALVGVQFAAASFLLIAVFVMVAQNKAMREAIWDSAGDPIVVVANDVTAAGVNAKLLKTELRRQPGVSAVGAMDSIPWTLVLPIVPITATREPSAARFQSTYSIVDVDLMETLGIKLLAGRVFEEGRAGDVANVEAWQSGSMAADYNVVVSRAMLTRFGLENPQDMVGKIMYQPTSLDGATPPRQLHVIGVVENSVVRPINGGYPTLYLMNPDTAVAPVIRISKRNVAATLAGIDSVWNGLVPDMPIKRRFADEQFEESFQFLRQIDRMFSALAVFASIIALMGLIGMALHIIRRRTLEIGVRKALGASVAKILWMLLSSFSKPVVLANVAVWPLVYFAMMGYLNLFAVRTGVTVVPFVISLVVTLLVAWLAILLQSTRAARMNPAIVLRYE